LEAEQAEEVAEAAEHALAEAAADEGVEGDDGIIPPADTGPERERSIWADLDEGATEHP
jgi:hypothetical protein